MAEAELKQSIRNEIHPMTKEQSIKLSKDSSTRRAMFLRVLVAVLCSSIAVTSWSCRSISRHNGPGRNLTVVDQDFNKLEFRRFENPDSFYWPAYFWQWNDSVTKELISRQLTDMKLHDARTVCLHPMPRAFRPNTMFTLMEPDYLTPEYFDLYRYAVEQCRKLKMRNYLYDEGGWPSGACLGRVVEQNPKLNYKQLARQVLAPKKGTAFSVPPDCLCAFLYQGNARVKQLVPGTVESINGDNARVMLFTVNEGKSWWPYPYPDLLNPASTREFIRLTHEEYRRKVGDYFGKTIHITFTDEAQVANPGWTDDIVTNFRDKYGYDLRNELPSIFEGDSDHDRKVRIDYFDWWSQRNADAYYGQIQDWCHQNNLLSSGHLNGEDATEFARKYGYGHPLRALRRMDVPGVDVIWRQLWPYSSTNHHFPKFASTVSHQAGVPWALSESFAVYGSGLTPGQMKWISDYQFVRGINLMVLSSYQQSTRDYFLGGIRPVFGPRNPLWRYQPDYHGYIARLGYLLSLGKPDIKTALYYPVRDIWAGGPDFGAVCSSNDETVKALLEHQCDFDFIDDDTLENSSTKAVNGLLAAGQMNYDMVCVSRSRYMSDTSISKLEQFIAAGGKVLWIGDAADIRKPNGAKLVTQDNLASFLVPTVALESSNPDIRVCKRIVNNGSIYFVTNEGTNGTSCTLRFNESRPMLQLDPESGKCRKPPRAFRISGGWSLPLNLNFAGSCVFMFTYDQFPLLPCPASRDMVLQTISDGWTCRKSAEFLLGEHDVEIQEHRSDQLVDIKLGDWRQTLGDSYSGDVEYIVKFKCTEFEQKNAQLLDLGDVRYVCQASLNGEELGKRLWLPFAFDVKGKIRKGNNVLKVIITNTLANQYTCSKALDKWPVKKLGPYHSRTLGFEKESLASGLFGPVTIKY